MFQEVLEAILSYLHSVMKCDSLYRICFLMLIVGACRADAWVSGDFRKNPVATWYDLHKTIIVIIF